MPLNRRHAAEAGGADQRSFRRMHSQGWALQCGKGERGRKRVRERRRKQTERTKKEREWWEEARGQDFGSRI